jgi:hypothetical protein
LLVCALMAGCGGESPEREAVSQQEQSLEEPGQAPPRVDSLEAVALEPLSRATRSLVRARLAKGESATEVLLSGDDNAQIALRDDGTLGDALAGDGVFSGTGIVDFDAHRQTQQRIAEVKQSGVPPTMLKFDDRAVVGEETLEPLPDSAFVQGQPIPIRLVGLVNGSISDAVAVAAGATATASGTNYARSLVITDPGVLNDSARTWNPCTRVGTPNGAWTFNFLMTEMANPALTGISPAAFTDQWLKHWTFNPSVNGSSVPARPAITTKLLNPWPKVGTALDMAQSPFKLVAIVNRPDLANPRGGAYGGGEAGELRFVFAAVERTSTSCYTTPFLVILEYGVPVSGCQAVKNWNRAWQQLSLYTPGAGSLYNSRLQSLTDSVVKRNAAPRKPNGSAINQVRTNEEWLAWPWELREFRLFSNNLKAENFRVGAMVGHLTEHTTAQAPADAHNNTPLLSNYITSSCAPLAASTHTVPLNFPTATNDFLGAFPRMPSTNTFWTAPTLCSPQARFGLSFNTCNGCHTRETYSRFWHIDQNSNRSPFLSGPITVTDPVFTTMNRTFNEPQRRIQVLDSLANQSCLAGALVSPPASH